MGNGTSSGRVYDLVWLRGIARPSVGRWRICFLEGLRHSGEVGPVLTRQDQSNPVAYTDRCPVQLLWLRESSRPEEYGLVSISHWGLSLLLRQCPMQVRSPSVPKETGGCAPRVHPETKSLESHAYIRLLRSPGWGVMKGLVRRWPRHGGRQDQDV